MVSEPLEQLKKNLAKIRARMEKACEKSGRRPEEVTLVAVTKSVEPEIAGLLLDAGVEHVGENRIPEAQRKRDHLGDRGIWHMIGHLQRNKVKKALPLFSMIHSVDSTRLMEEISQRCEARGLPMEILLEVNVSGEASKYGFTPEALPEAVIAARGLPGLKLRGLMTMAPYDPDPEAARPHFQALHRLLNEIQKEGHAGPECNLLSMGMSGDFEVAVEEGATHVRVGTALYEGL
jgi:pyridoxal phosphate enzyme (YggS family)